MSRLYRQDILKDFYINRVEAIKNIAIVYLENAFEGFFKSFPFDEKNIIEYDAKLMRSHIIFDLLRAIGDIGYRTFETLIDYIHDVYNRKELETAARIHFERIKLKDVN